MPNLKRLLILTVAMTLFCGGYVLFAPSPPPLPMESWQHDLAEVLGNVVVGLFTIIYGRTLLKILLRQGPLLDRLLPLDTASKVTGMGKTILPLLNQTHPYVGVATLVLIACHALLMGLNQANLLLRIVLVLIAWQLVFGLFLISRYQAVFVNKMKRYGYMAHSQLYTGIMIGTCALFGHLLLPG